MKRVALVLSLTMVLLLSVGAALFVNFANANPYRTDITYYETPDPSKPSVALVLQTGGPTYNVRNVAYSFTILKPRTWTHNYLFSAQYFLDGVRVDEANQSSIEDPKNYANAAYHTPTDTGAQPLCLKGFMREVSDGNHTIFFNVTCVSYYYPQEWRSIYFWWKMPPEEFHYDVSSSMINFTVDATPPAVSVLSIENKNYTSNEIPLTFSTSEITSQLSYCLDGLENLTITGNTTLTNLPNGPHALTVYANDTAGNVGASKTINFNSTQESEKIPVAQPEAFPTVLTAAFSATALIAVAMGLVLHFKKRKH